MRCDFVILCSRRALPRSLLCKSSSPVCDVALPRAEDELAAAEKLRAEALHEAVAGMVISCMR